MKVLGLDGCTLVYSALCKHVRSNNSYKVWLCFMAYQIL